MSLAVGRSRPRSKLSASIVFVVFVVRLRSRRRAWPSLQGPWCGLGRLAIGDTSLPSAGIAGAKSHPRTPVFVVIDRLGDYGARLTEALRIGPAVVSNAFVRSPASLGRHLSLGVPPRRPRATRGLEELGVVAKGEGRFLCARGVPGVSGSLFKGGGYLRCGRERPKLWSRTSLRFPLFSK